MLAAASLLVAGLSPSSPARAHALVHQTSRAEAVVLRLHFQGSDDQPWAEPYELYAPGSVTPDQRGQVNTAGEIIFRPHTPGTWRVRVITEDGHGTEVKVEVDAAGLVAPAQAPAPALGQRVLTGLAWVFGLFGVLVLWRQRRAPSPGRPG